MVRRMINILRSFFGRAGGKRHKDAIDEAMAAAIDHVLAQGAKFEQELAEDWQQVNARFEEVARSNPLVAEMLVDHRLIATRLQDPDPEVRRWGMRVAEHILAGPEVHPPGLVPPALLENIGFNDPAPDLREAALVMHALDLRARNDVEGMASLGHRLALLVADASTPWDMRKASYRALQLLERDPLVLSTTEGATDDAGRQDHRLEKLMALLASDSRSFLAFAAPASPEQIDWGYVRSWLNDHSRQAPGGTNAAGA